jgi:lipid-A-disaccharide synthase
LVLALLPFEPALYAKHGFRAEFVGHPLADAIPEDIDRAAVRRSLQLRSGPLAAILPGSRFGEVKRLGPLFVETAQWLAMRRPDLQFVIPAATPSLKSLIETQIAASQPKLPVTVLTGRSREVLQAADAVLLASGTASLEAMLCACPMVVAYRLSPMSYALIGASILRRIQHVALPNLLAGQVVVPELMQDRMVPADMGVALLSLLEESQARDTQLRKFRALAGVLRRGADGRAAEAVLQLLTAHSAVKR